MNEEWNEGLCLSLHSSFFVGGRRRSNDGVFVLFDLRIEFGRRWNVQVKKKKKKTKIRREAMCNGKRFRWRKRRKVVRMSRRTSVKKNPFHRSSSMIKVVLRVFCLVSRCVGWVVIDSSRHQTRRSTESSLLDRSMERIPRKSFRRSKWRNQGVARAGWAIPPEIWAPPPNGVALVKLRIEPP